MKRFLNRSAVKSFWICFLLYTLLLIASLGWKCYDQVNGLEKSNLNEVVFTLHQLINFAYDPKKVALVKQRFSKMRTMKVVFPWNLHIEIAEQALPNAMVVLAVNNWPIARGKIHKLVHQHRDGLRISYKIVTGQWINVSMQPLQHQTLYNKFMLLFLMLWFAFGGFLYVVTRYLSMPIADFSQAIRRLGVDLNAPPLSAIGDEQMQLCIHDFNEMQQRIREIVRERTQLLAAISHDLKTPITRLKLRVERFEGTPDYVKFVKDLDEMEAMISSILTYASQTAREEVRRTFDLEALIQTLCDDMFDAGKKVSFIGLDKRLVIKGQLNGIKRCLVNLIDNAIKYGHEAVVEMTVMDNKLVKITITDKGPGIPEGNFDLAFKPFERLDHSRSANVAGSGLGLAIVKETITAHHGDITLVNQVEGGLRVCVTLPLS